MNIRPQDLPELRAEIVDSIRNRPDDSPWQELIASGHSPFRSAPRMPSARQHAETDEALVRQAELFHVTAEMTQLARAAAPGLPAFEIQHEDLPARAGLIAFAEPLVTVEFGQPAVPSPVYAACWRALAIGSKPRLWIKFFSSREAWLPATAKAEGWSKRQIVLSRAVLPRLSPMLGSDCIGPIGAGTRGEEPVNATAKGFQEATRIVRAAWLLMQQPLTRETAAGPDRSSCKRLRRAGHEPVHVRVVELRRPKTTSGTGDTDREYQHQWIVRGHWRQQWHPKRQVHRPVWIAPHIKGPEGAPLIGGEKVYALKR